MTDEYRLETPTPDYTDGEWAELDATERRAAWDECLEREQEALVDRDVAKETPASPRAWVEWFAWTLILIALVVFGWILHTAGLFAGVWP